MKRQIQRLVLILFVLLQGMAPLLHAHTAADAHGGVHLPGLAGDTNDHDHPGVTDDAHQHVQTIIGVETSLEARHDGPPLDIHLPSRRLTPTESALAEAWPIALSAEFLPAPPLHTLPAPRAPPHP